MTALTSPNIKPMLPTTAPRDCEFLEITSVTNVITRRQLQDHCLDGVKDRQVRRSCQRLSSRGLLRRMSPVFADPTATAACYAYSITENGLHVLAEQMGDPSVLLRPSSPPPAPLMRHELVTTQIQLTLMKAVARSTSVELVRQLRRGHIVNPEEPDTAKRTSLRFELSNGKPLFCEPDYAFVLQSGAARVGYCLETETGANGAKRKIARSHQGYAAFADSEFNRYAVLFPDVTKGPFLVLAVAPTAGYRDQMRQAIADKPARALWRFAAYGDLNAESFLFQPVWFLHDQSEPMPLLNP